VLPDIPGVEQAFIGVIPATEFMKLIENTNEEIITSIFYDTSVIGRSGIPSTRRCGKHLWTRESAPTFLCSTTG
jgi:hypothetical protein